MRLEKLHILVLLLIAAVFWTLVLLCQGTPVAWSHFKPVGIVSTLLGLLAVIFERWAWRIPFLHGWFVKRPDLRGTWRVVLKSEWINPETGRGIPEIICYMGVKQTLSTLQMHLMTPESESWLIAEDTSESPSGEDYQIAGVYNNKPKTELRSTRSAIHYGSILFYTHGPIPHRPETIDGEYWTDRPTKGRMTLTNRNPKVFTRFKDANRAFDGD